VPSAGGHVRSLGTHLRALQAEGKKVVFVSADRPYHTLTVALREHGVAVESIHFVDAVSSLSGSAPAQRPPNATFLPSPTMLEMLAMRVEQAALRLGPGAHMVLDSLDTLSLYNGIHPVQEFSHYLANRLRAHGLHGDFVVRGTDRALQDLVTSFTDGRVDLPAEPAVPVPPEAPR
jgi:KaiC/GvpD/RAD55 family RecA-like ATPase